MSASREPSALAYIRRCRRHGKEKPFRRPHACRLTLASEAWQVGKRDLARMHMHSAEFSATAELRKHLARIEQAVRIEGAFQPLLLIEVDLVEHRVHEIALLENDPLLPCQNAANVNTEPE